MELSPFDLSCRNIAKVDVGRRLVRGDIDQSSAVRLCVVQQRRTGVEPTAECAEKLAGEVRFRTAIPSEQIARRSDEYPSVVSAKPFFAEPPPVFKQVSGESQVVFLIQLEGESELPPSGNVCRQPFRSTSWTFQVP